MPAPANVLFYNPRAGSIKRGEVSLEAVLAVAREIDPNASLRECAPDELGACVRAAAESGARTVAVCGGDGTVSSAAGAILGTGAALGVIPLGTLNHFARDLGIPLDPASALRVAFGTGERRVDVGRAGHRVFVNNCCFGFYPTLVDERRKVEDSMGRIPAVAQAVGKVLQSLPTEVLRITVDEQTSLTAETPLMFIGNNKYNLTIAGPGQRARLDEGLLSVCVARAGTQMELLAQAFATLFLGPERVTGVECMTAERVRVVSAAGRIKVGVDGESLEMDTPLEVSILPSALRVRVP